MGSGLVQLSPQWEVSNFKKLWLLARCWGVLSCSWQGRPRSERCSELQHLPVELWGCPPRSVAPARSRSHVGPSLLLADRAYQPWFTSEEFEDQQG